MSDEAYGGLTSGYLIRATSHAGVWFYGSDNSQAASPVALQNWTFSTQAAAEELVDRLKLHSAVDRTIEVLDIHMTTAVTYTVASTTNGKAKPEPRRRGPAGSRPGTTG